LEASNVAHAGLFWMLNVSGSRSASSAVGLNEYGCPSFAEVTGVPVMVGGRLTTGKAALAGAATVIVNAGSDFNLLPSLTEMRMLENVPATVGVPLRRPVLVLKLAQDGRLLTENPSVWPSGSDAEGWNE
jgi:hypothetical protein